MEKKLVFLLYDNRSGSTLLSALLNRYKGVSVSQESVFIHRIIEYKNTISTDRIEKVFQALSEEVQFTELDFDREKFMERMRKTGQGSISKKNLIELIITDYFKNRDGNVVVRVIKQGDYLYIREILDMFPDSVFLQIIRDGRAVFNSKKQTCSFEGKPQDTNPLHAAWNWVQKLKIAESYHQKFITVRYEDLIKNPEPTLNQVLIELNVPPDLRIKTKKQEDYSRNLGIRQKPLHQHIEQKPRVDFAHRWKTQLSGREIMVFTYWSKKTLEKYGYETSAYSTFSVYLYSFGYLVLYVFDKAVNVFKLLKNPSRLRVKLRRKARMMIEN